MLCGQLLQICFQLDEHIYGSPHLLDGDAGLCKSYRGNTVCMIPVSMYVGLQAAARYSQI